jgi:hypothetical protein
MSNYYRILDDIGRIDRWHLGVVRGADGAELDPWQFTRGQRTQYDVPLAVDIAQHGRCLDFTFAAFDVPIVSGRAAELIGQHAADLQLIPALVPSYGTYYILNVLNISQCLDESRSEFIKWTKADRRPDRIGSYRSVTELVIEPGRIDAHIARVQGWEIALVISQALKMCLETHEVSGVLYQLVL